MVYEYIVNNPVKFIDHFSVKKDTSVWNGEYFKNSNGHFPQRMKVLHESSLFQVVNDSV